MDEQSQINKLLFFTDYLQILLTYITYIEY
jgi:hypothetical protein